MKVQLDRVGGCYGTYKTVVEAANDPVLVHDNPLFGMSENPSGLAYPAPGSFANIPQQERGAPQSAPLLGQHTDELMERVLGLSPGQVAALHDKGLVVQA